MQTGRRRKEGNVEDRRREGKERGESMRKLGE